MSSAPSSKTGRDNPSATKLQAETEPTTEATVPSKCGNQPAGSKALPDDSSVHRPKNRPLDVSDLTLRFQDGTLISGNKLPLHNETPILLTVRITNKPEGVEYMVMNVIVSELGKNGHREGRSGKFSKNVRTTTYKKTVPIVTDAGGRGHSMTIEIPHATAPSGAFHGGDGPYDMTVSCTPDTTASDDAAISQVDETLKYTFEVSHT